MNNNLLNNVVRKIENNQQIVQEYKGVDKKTIAEATNSLFEELLVIFPSYLAMIKKNSPEDAKRLYNKTKKMWLDEIVDERLTPQMIQLGLKKCKKSDSGFMPTVGEFVSWCKPTDEDLGIPSIDSAYTEACQHTRGKKAQEYSHVIVYEAGKMTGFFELVSKAESTMKPKFKEKYNHLREKLLRGEEIHVISNALEDKTSEKPVDNRTEQERKEAKNKAAEDALNSLTGIFK